MKGRNNHEVVFNTGCSATTNHYMHMNEYCIAEVEEDWGGCGTRKDHSRVYLCPNCYDRQ